MDKVTRCTRELTAAICACQAYADYEAVKEKMKENPQLRTQLNQFRRRNYELQNSKDEVEWFEAMERFEKEKAEISKNPLIEEYLSRELEMCRMIQRISESITRVVQLEIEDFADAIEW